MYNIYSRRKERGLKSIPRPTRFYSRQQERQVAKATNGQRTANSGATMFSKGDVRTENFLIECKTCAEPRKSFTLHKEWFNKNKEEAFAMHKDYSALVFDFGDGERFYCIDERLFQKLQNYITEENKNGRKD